MPAPDAYLSLANSGLGLEARRVLDVLMARLDCENWVHTPQTELAELLNMKPPHVSRAIRDLVQAGVLQAGPKLGRATAYRLNPGFGWADGAKSAAKRTVKVGGAVVAVSRETGQ